jgi:pyridoxamine 5'-phosphate oxidase
VDSGDDMDALPQPRDDYTTGVLDEGSVPDDPIELLRHWLDAAVAAEVPEPTAATLATVDRDGRPDARVVLLRGSDERGVWWFTNRRSAKGEQLRANPVGAVVAYWPPLERQVRLRGPSGKRCSTSATRASSAARSAVGADCSEAQAPMRLASGREAK